MTAQDHGFRIAVLGQETAPLLAEMHAEAFSGGEVWDSAAFAGLLSVPGTSAYVSQYESEPTGFLLLRTIAGESEVLTLAVRPAFRRRGVGRQLVRACTQHAPVFLEVSFCNSAAIALYRNCGFTEIGVRRAYYPDGSDAIVFVFKI